MPVMNRSLFPKSFRAGLNAVIGLDYEQYKGEYDAIFEKKTTKKAFEEQVLRVGFGSAVTKTEGAAFSEDAGAESWTQRYESITLGLRFQLTQEAKEDNLYEDLGQQYGKELSRAFVEAKEIMGAAILNRATTAGYTGGDGVTLLSTAHPLYYGGTLSNKLATPANISESALEELLIQLRRCVNDRGNPQMVKPVRLLISPDQEFNTYRILNSIGRVETDNNDVNAIKGMGIFREKPQVVTRLNSSTAWFIKTDAPYGLQYFQRIGFEKGNYQDENTGNLVQWARERCAFGFTDPRTVYGSEGSA